MSYLVHLHFNFSLKYSNPGIIFMIFLSQSKQLLGWSIETTSRLHPSTFFVSYNHYHSFLCYISYTTKKALWNEQRINNTNYGHQIMLCIFGVHVVILHCSYKYFLKVIYISSHLSFQGHKFCVVDEGHLKCWKLYELFMLWRTYLISCILAKWNL